MRMVPRLIIVPGIVVRVILFIAKSAVVLLIATQAQAQLETYTQPKALL